MKYIFYLSNVQKVETNLYFPPILEYSTVNNISIIHYGMRYIPAKFHQLHKIVRSNTF